MYLKKTGILIWPARYLKQWPEILSEAVFFTKHGEITPSFYTYLKYVSVLT